ncbi:MAG: glycosyltransferase [Paludibacter sp.]
MKLPKVLIVGQSFNSDTGGGITLSNLFKGWDRDKLAVACSGYLLLDNIDTDVCNTYYQLGEKEQKWRFPFSFLKRKYKSGLVQFSSEKIQNMTIPKSKIRVSIILNVFYPLLQYLGVIHLMRNTSLSEELCSWLDEYKPDVIYAQTTSRDGISFCLAIQDYLKKPLIYHVMDDWPSTISQKGLLKNYWHNKIDQELRVLLDRADVLMSISEEMASEYKARYNKDFIPFHNTIDVDFWKKYQRNTYDLPKSPTILYAGRIGLGIDSSLELIAKAIQGINDELNLSIRFVLQTQDKPSWIGNYSSVYHSGFVAYSDLPRVFAESDMLLLPYDFHTAALKFIKFSMPTKVPEYMITGTPIIIFAPEVTALVKYAQKYEWAKVITKNDIGAVTCAITQLIENQELRKKYAKNAIELAEKNHNSADVTNQFKKVICITADVA